MWKNKNSLQTTYRYAYDVALAKRERLQHDRYLWNQWTAVRDEASIWCEENCTMGWSHYGLGFSFDSKDDAMMFKLIWAGRVC